MRQALIKFLWGYVQQIDDVLIDGRHASSILDVCTMRAANIDSDHYLVLAKVTTRIAPVKKSVAFTCRKFAFEKLQLAQTAKAFENRLTTLLAEKQCRKGTAIEGVRRNAYVTAKSVKLRGTNLMVSR